MNGLHHQPRAHGISTVPEEDAHVVDFAGLASIDHQSDLGTLLVLHQVMVNTTARNEGRKGDAIHANCSIRQDDDLDAIFDRL